MINCLAEGGERPERNFAATYNPQAPFNQIKNKHILRFKKEGGGT
jgi:hypothetical protein